MTNAEKLVETRSRHAMFLYFVEFNHKHLTKNVCPLPFHFITFKSSCDFLEQDYYSTKVVSKRFDYLMKQFRMAVIWPRYSVFLISNLVCCCICRNELLLFFLHSQKSKIV